MVVGQGRGGGEGGWRRVTPACHLWCHGLDLLQAGLQLLARSQGPAAFHHIHSIRSHAQRRLAGPASWQPGLP